MSACDVCLLVKKKLKIDKPQTLTPKSNFWGLGLKKGGVSCIYIYSTLKQYF